MHLPSSADVIRAWWPLSGKAACAAAVPWPYPNPLLKDQVRLLTDKYLLERSNSYLIFMSSPFKDLRL